MKTQSPCNQGAFCLVTCCMTLKNIQCQPTLMNGCRPPTAFSYASTRLPSCAAGRQAAGWLAHGVTDTGWHRKWCKLHRVSAQVQAHQGRRWHPSGTKGDGGRETFPTGKLVQGALARARATRGSGKNIHIARTIDTSSAHLQGPQAGAVESKELGPPLRQPPCSVGWVPPRVGLLGLPRGCETGTG